MQFLFESVEVITPSKVDPAGASRVIDASQLSQEQLDVALERGYADIQAGNALDAKQAFNRIRQS